MIAICHHGSFNYELNIPDSDFDVKLILAPTWEEVITCASPTSKTICGPYGDINITDVRLFIGVNLKKQNFNFLECLFTPYMCVNPEYADLWNLLIENREEVAHYKPDQALHTMMGQVENQYGRWGRYDKKKTLYHMMRMAAAIEAYQKGLSFADTLIAPNADTIMEVRLGKVCEEDMDFLFRLAYDQAHYCAERMEYQGAQYECESFLYELQTQFVYRALYELRIEE